MFKKILLLLIAAIMSMSLVACGGEETLVALGDDEKDILEQMEEDINVVTDDTYVEVMGELLGHVGQYNGQVYQLEGVYTVEGDTVSVSRTLVNGEEKTTCGLPMQYQTKDIENGSWIRVTGVINSVEVEGENITVLDIVAIEALAQTGEAELEWEGEFQHHH